MFVVNEPFWSWIHKLKVQLTTDQEPLRPLGNEHSDVGTIRCRGCVTPSRNHSTNPFSSEPNLWRSNWGTSLATNLAQGQIKSRHFGCVGLCQLKPIYVAMSLYNLICAGGCVDASLISHPGNSGGAPSAPQTSAHRHLVYRCQVRRTTMVSYTDYGPWHHIECKHKYLARLTRPYSPQLCNSSVHG